jgi:hypothetical protein
MQRRTLLEYKRFRYLKVALWLNALAILAYLIHRPAFGAYGGTWLGYTLGVISAAIVLLLLWFGIRKRQYRGAGVLQGWLSAHVYLGVSLIVLATLHTGFQFGWNVHTLSYLLMLFVIINGFYGLFAYLRFPGLITKNLGEDTLDGILLRIAELDELARLNALQLPDEVNEIVRRARQETRIGGNMIQQLIGRQVNCPTSEAVAKLREFGKNLKGGQPKHCRELYLLMLRREALVASARRDVMLRANLGIWLYLHIPLSVALLVTLIAHVTSTFFFW